jgi:hypothetical protein
MEVAMKTYTKLTAGLLFASFQALGQSNGQGLRADPSNVSPLSSFTREYVQNAITNYHVALNSANDGIVESAIANLAYIRIGLPQMDLGESRAAIAEIAESGRTPVARYKAYLATLVFENPESYVNALKTESTVSDRFFSGVAAEVQKTFLGHIIQ